MHNESELDRVLGIEDVQLIGINNRNLGMSMYIPLLQSLYSYNLCCPFSPVKMIVVVLRFCSIVAETKC